MRPGKATAVGKGEDIQRVRTIARERVHAQEGVRAGDDVHDQRCDRVRDRKERVLFVTTSWPSSDGDPAGHFVRAHAREFERRGSDVVVVAPKPGGAFGWPGVAARIRAQPLRSLEAARWIVFARRQVVRIVANRVVAHWAVPSGWPIATAARVPLEVVSHGGDVRLLAALTWPARRAIVRKLATQATTWSFASADLLRQLLDTLDRPVQALVGRVAVVHAPPIEMPDVKDAVSRLRRDLGSIRVAVCVARLIAAKRVDRAIEYVARTDTLDALVIVGDGPERGRLERLAQALHVKTRFVGAVTRPEALAWVGSAHALLHASEAEGLSTVVREAHMLGTPVVRLASS
jgi:glycosyltransferase involved in cell wall biosynthesis